MKQPARHLRLGRPNKFSTMKSNHPVSHAPFWNAIIAICALVVLGGCDEKTKKAAEVLKEKAEDKLVKLAGEGEVALKLSQQQYADLKEKLVRIKTLRTSAERQMNEAKANAERLRAAGKTDEAGLNERRAEMYEKNLNFLKEREPLAEASLREYSAVYEEQKQQIKLLKEEIEMYKASGSLNENLSVDSPAAKRADTIKSLMSKLQEKSDRAKALFDVGKLEETLK